MYDYTRKNRMAVVSAMTNGAVKASTPKFSYPIDLIETDYHDL